MARPSFQWYPGDWRRDTALQSTPLAVRGLWAEMLNIMHDGEPYGHLTAGGVPITPQELARMVGGSLREVRVGLTALEAKGVYSRTAEGVIYSRRMVRDERILQARINGGKGAPQPNAKGGGEGPKVTPTPQPILPTSGIPPAVCSLQSSSAEQEQERDAPADADALAALWNERTTPPLKPVSRMTAARRRHGRARLSERSLDEWAVVIDRVQASDFCRGRSERGWLASFDWLVKSPDVAVKVLEGSYDNRTPQAPANRWTPRTDDTRDEPWGSVYDGLRARLPRHDLETWFGDATTRVDGLVLSVIVPDQMHADWITKHYAEELREVVQDVIPGFSAEVFAAAEVPA